MLCNPFNGAKPETSEPDKVFAICALTRLSQNNGLPKVEKENFALAAGEVLIIPGNVSHSYEKSDGGGMAILTVFHRVAED